MRMSCKVLRNRHGNLYFRLYWQGYDLREGTRWQDTKDNRAKAERWAEQWTREMEAGTFDYLKWFPRGNKAKLFRQEAEKKEPQTLQRYYDQWIDRFRPPLAKRSRWRNYRSHFEQHIIPQFGARPIDAISAGDIRSFSQQLITAGLTIKSVRNILNGSFRALLRDAQVDGLLDRNPFALLPANWLPQTVQQPPDPFTEQERDQILDYLKERLAPKWPAGYVYAYTLFWTGMRPSELTARKWRDLDPITGKLEITTSRTEGGEGLTKTQQSRRVISLFAPVLEAIKTIQPLVPDPTGYILTERSGEPIDQKTFAARIFQPALKACRIRPRPFYNTRHTFISTMLMHGEDILQIAAYCGNSPAIISRHYARWTRGRGNFGEAAMGVSRALPATRSASN